MNKSKQKKAKNQFGKTQLKKFLSRMRNRMIKKGTQKSMNIITKFHLIISEKSNLDLVMKVSDICMQKITEIRLNQFRKAIEMFLKNQSKIKPKEYQKAIEVYHKMSKKVNQNQLKKMIKTK